MKKGLVGLTLILVLLCVLGATSADATTVKMSYNGPADEVNNAVHYYAVNFKKMVEEGTKGKIHIQLYPDSQLGNEEERMELLMKSGLNQPIINVASYAGMAPVLPELYAHRYLLCSIVTRQRTYFSILAAIGPNLKMNSRNELEQSYLKRLRREDSLPLQILNVK